MERQVMPLPRQVEAAKVMVEAAEEAAKKHATEGGSDHQNPIIEGASPKLATDATVTPTDGGEIVLDWENEYKTLSGQHDKLERRFAVIQGKYNSEVPLLHKEIQELKAKVSGGGETVTVDDDSGTVDENAEVKQLYGEDLVNFIVGRDTKSQEKIDALQSRVDSFGETSQETLVDNFFGKIEEAHPNWSVINRTSAFINFLKQLIPDLGITRQQIIDKAQDDGNPQPIIDQLTAFKAHLKTGSGNNSQVVPVDSGGSEIPTNDSGKLYNESEVSKFYKDMGNLAAQGKPVSTTDEYKRLDAEYSKAAREGRIVAGQ